MFAKAALLVLAGVAGADAFMAAPMLRSAPLGLKMEMSKVGNVNEIPAGERKVTKVGDKDVMVVNHKGSIYALSPKCPHLGLPMKTGEISDDGPCITCKFHGSKFRLDTGECVEWSESVMGLPGTKFLGNIVGGIGGEKNSPATVFKSSVDKDGNIIVDV